MKILSIIPARGGSVGIFRKNIIPIAGKPMIAWNIEAALASRKVNRIVVSTEDPEIANVSREYGAEVIKRPIEISGDMASSESALIHVLDELKKKENYVPDLLVFLQCTSPLTIAEDIDNCIEKLLNENADTALSVTDFHYFIWQDNEKKEAEGVNHEKSIRLLRQERECQKIETGAIYVMKTDGFLIHKHRFFGKTVMSEMPEERCFEIDVPVDLKITETLLRERQLQKTFKLIPSSPDALVLDFDGVFTDNKVYLDQNGIESVQCDRADGMGLSLLKQTGLPVFVISKEKNEVTLRRCEKLGIECYHGIDNKLELLKQLCNKKNIKLANTIYLGNDINDFECLDRVGCGVVVADAHSSVFSVADIILKNKGGKGAIRELCDCILEKFSDS